MDSEKTKLTNEEARQKLEAGEKLEKVFIERLTIARKSVAYPIHLVECDIEHLDFNNATFEEDVTIRRCQIRMFVGGEATFKKKLDLQGSEIGRGRFHSAVIEGDFNGKQGCFKNISFHESQFRGNFNSWGGEFRNSTFSQVTFQETIFTEALFEGKINFQKSIWKGNCDMRRMKVDETLDFQGSTFEKDLFFQGSVIKMWLDMGQCKMEGMVDFRDTAIGHSLILSGVTLGEKQGFRFLNASASSIILNRETVEGHIFPESEKKYRAASREYAFLRTTFQNINRFEDEDWAYYQFKRMERKGNPFTWNPIKWIQRAGSFLFLDLGCGYGTKPFRTLLVGALLIILFSIGFFIHYSGSPIHENYGLESRIANEAIYSLDLSLMAFSGGYSNLTIQGPIRLLAMAEYLIGVVFMGLFIVAFSRKVIR